MDRAAAAGHAPLNVLVVAPFARGRAHGGSYRATAVAERLEARGAAVTWATTEREPGSALDKARALVRGTPGIVRTNTTRPAGLDGRFDVAVAAHSYLAPRLDDVDADRRLVDFHNLEWRVLEATGQSTPGPRSAYLRHQAVLMRRFERRVVTSRVFTAFATEEELAWARAQGARDAVLAPNLLPAAAFAAAEQLGRRRAARPASRLVYVGTLTFPPNVSALLRFLQRTWPEVRAALPHVSLDVAGRGDGATLEQIAAHPGVRALGFVPDLGGVLCDAAAAVLPFDGDGGSSLRLLHYALARVPVIATGTATRGLPFGAALTADDPAAWIAAVERCLDGDPDVAALVDEAERGVRALHADDEPWDALWRLVAPCEAVAA